MGTGSPSHWAERREAAGATGRSEQEVGAVVVVVVGPAGEEEEE